MAYKVLETDIHRVGASEYYFLRKTPNEFPLRNADVGLTLDHSHWSISEGVDSKRLFKRHKININSKH